MMVAILPIVSVLPIHSLTRTVGWDIGVASARGAANGVRPRGLALSTCSAGVGGLVARRSVTLTPRPLTPSRVVRTVGPSIHDLCWRLGGISWRYVFLLSASALNSVRPRFGQLLVCL